MDKQGAPRTKPPAKFSNHPVESNEQHDVQGLHSSIMREKADPRDGFEPVPIWLVSLFGIILFWGGTYLQKYSADFRPDIYDESPMPGAVIAAAKPVDPVTQGKTIYAAQGCVSCHQANGRGQPGQFPPLAGSEWVVGSTARLNRILLHGLQGPIQVAGAEYNNNMPAFGTKLKDDKLAALLTFIRQEWGNQAPAITPESVAAAREATKDRSTPWTAAELEAVQAEDQASAPPAAAAPVAAPQP